MKVNCPKCDQPFKDGQEIKGVFLAYFHDIPSKRVVSTTTPHDFIAETMEHVSCREVEDDESLSSR